MKCMTTALFLAAAVTASLAGCASYNTPGAAADFSKIGLTEEDVRAQTDVAIREAMAKKPMVVFPASIAVVRVQSAEYGGSRYSSAYAYGHGSYSVITVRDVEKEEDYERMRKLPQVAGIAPIKRILLPAQLKSDTELRTAAVKLRAGLLMYYTFDTKFYTDTRVKPLTPLTLGLAPNKEANVVTTASAVLMDSYNGYVYGVYEATSSRKQLANAWTSEEAMDQIRKAAEREAFEKLVDEFTTSWPGIVTAYHKPAATQAAK